jgi:membrane protease YdiL (CAAX protease family)
MAMANGVDPGSPSCGVAGSVVVTAVAGLGFCWLRLRFGHLAAPVVAHAGMNASATVAAHLALTWS